MRETARREVFDKTSGHCHFCGDALIFDRRGWKKRMDGHWELDHIIQRGKGGVPAAENCLPACTRCNRLRWHRKGSDIRDLLLLGVVAAKEIKKNSLIGAQLRELRSRHLAENERRRRKRRHAA
jgi:hypothetical protein